MSFCILKILQFLQASDQPIKSLTAMPKMKSNSGAKKRFKLTGSGKIKREKAYASHILTKKSRKRKRDLHQSTLVSPQDAPRVHRMLQA